MSTSQQLIPKRFYFFRAWYEWITDNHLTAYIIVDASFPNVSVPKEYIQDGRITLNISPQAVNHLKITPKVVEFEADFESLGIVFISIPIQAIVAIYADENGQGTLFPEEEVATSSSPEFEEKKAKKRPELTIVE